MERGHQRNADVLAPLSAEPGDRRIGPEQRLRRELPEGDDDLGPDRVQLRLEEGLAGLDLVRLGVAVARRPALHDVADVDLVAAVAHRGDHLRQELARRRRRRGCPGCPPPRPGPRPRRPGAAFGLPDAEDEVLAARAQLAALAVAQRAADLVEERRPAGPARGHGCHGRRRRLRWTAGARAVEPAGRGEPEGAGDTGWITASAHPTSVTTSAVLDDDRRRCWTPRR